MPARTSRYAAPARAGRVAASLVATALVLTACTHSANGHATAGTGGTTSAPTGRSTDAGRPISTAPVIEKAGGACPYLSLATAYGDVGFRLDRVTILTRAGRTVGCRFYSPQHAVPGCDQTCIDNENLPPASVPGIEVLSSQYASATAARVALVKVATSGTNPQQVTIAPGNVGVCFQTSVLAQDKGEDWACAFAATSRTVVVRTVVTSPALDVLEVARAVAKHL